MKVKLGIEVSMPQPTSRARACPVCFEHHDEEDECNMGIRNGPIPGVLARPEVYAAKLLNKPVRGTFRKKKHV